MRNQQARLLASAGLIAGITVGSLVLANTASTSALTAGLTATSAAAAGSSSSEVTAAGDGRLTGLVASLARMNVEDVRWQRYAGLSLVRIAGAKGVKAEDIVEAALDDLAARLDSDVAAGRITAGQRDRVLESQRAPIEQAILATV